ncbi:hypothetical protein [Streptomyces lincolnensis]|uniref:hypothetical protein n=1 Tax=Streptomyces lincolnensis TaxID=1915 RepID=UPI0037D7EAA5
MLYDVTLPGHQVPTHVCPQLGCEKTFKGHFTEKHVAAWNAIFEQTGDTEAAVKAHLKDSGAYGVDHVSGCPFRYLPPAVLVLCSDRELIKQADKVRAVLKDL